MAAGATDPKRLIIPDRDINRPLSLVTRPPMTRLGRWRRVSSPYLGPIAATLPVLRITTIRDWRGFALIPRSSTVNDVPTDGDEQDRPDDDPSYSATTQALGKIRGITIYVYPESAPSQSATASPPSANGADAVADWDGASPLSPEIAL